MNAVRMSFIRVAGHWVRVPNWVIVERTPWSTERKERARDNAARLGQLEAAVYGSRVWPWLVLAAGAGLFWLAGWAGEVLAGGLPKPF